MRNPYWGERYGYPAGEEPGGEEESTSPYEIGDIICDGCFLDRAALESMLQRLQTKRNIILQGPPGTGKTWLAKRLAYALIGQKDEEKVRQVQFHPNLYYEDFVCGWRPQSDGTLGLVDGPFLGLSEIARQDSIGTYVMVVEEISKVGRRRVTPCYRSTFPSAPFRTGREAFTASGSPVSRLVVSNKNPCYALVRGSHEVPF